MKFTLLAAIATFALAYDPQDFPETITSADVTLRWDRAEPAREGKRGKKEGTHMKDKQELREELRAITDRAGKKNCAKGVKQFDAYCHQYKVSQMKVDRGTIPKYADLRNVRDDDTETYSCDYDDDLAQLACLGQDCMFDYCIWRRDEFLAECIANNGDQDRDDWGDVYDFDNMHGDLQSNGGEWPNATCDDYYELKQQLQTDGTFDEAGY